jgi:hypothetical protein
VRILERIPPHTHTSWAEQRTERDQLYKKYA